MEFEMKGEFQVLDIEVDVSQIDVILRNTENDHTYGVYINLEEPFYHCSCDAYHYCNTEDGARPRWCKHLSFVCREFMIKKPVGVA